MIGAALHYSTKDNIFINWIAVSNKKVKAFFSRNAKIEVPHDNNFVEKVNLLHSDRMSDYKHAGIGSFMLSLVQLVASNVNLHVEDSWLSSNNFLPMYCQANFSEDNALLFYVRNGFEFVQADTCTKEEEDAATDDNAILNKNVLEHLPDLTAIRLSNIT